MSITSLQFIIFFVVSLVIYYLVPKKSQWICLLISSGLFFLLSSNWITGIYDCLYMYNIFLRKKNESI